MTRQQAHNHHKRQLRKLKAALRECEEVLRLVEHVPFPDRSPLVVAHVAELGERIGYGNLMATASSIWGGKDRGGQFVAGPCHGTVLRTLRIVRGALR